jgi:carboxymethylenebutenolidase
MRDEATSLYSQFEAGNLDRRSFLKRVFALAGGAAAVSALLPEIGMAQDVAADDARLKTEYITYPAPAGEMKAYLARPKGGGKFPAVIVVHEIYGLNANIEDVARRIALEGYVAIVPNALTKHGFTPTDRDEVFAAMRGLDPEETTNNYLAAVKFMESHPESNGKLGCVGFSWGGGMANQLAVHAPNLLAVVPFYGRQPALADVPKIKAALLLQYAGDDARVNAGIAQYEEALKAASVDYEVDIYTGAAHGFFNNTSSRYHPEAAGQAWTRMMTFFKKKLH